MESDKKESFAVRTLERGTAILDVFIQERRPLSVAELHRILNLSRSTVWRLVKVLETNKFLVKKTHSEQYWLGSKVLQLAAVFSEQSEISALATPILLDLRNSTRETVHLNIREENERVCIYCLEGFEPIRSGNQEGQRSPLHLGASAKVLLAGMDDNSIKKYIDDKHMDSSTASAVLREVEQIRQQGYSASRQERIPEMVAISAPVKNPAGQTVAALSLTGPITREKSILENHTSKVIEAAKKLSIQLGCLCL